MSTMTTRLATNADGPAIAALVAPKDESLSFDRVEPYWLVAELPERGIVGCVQTCPSRPVGHLEMLVVSDALSPFERGQVSRRLFIDGCAILYGHGATHVRGFLAFSSKSLKRVLKKRGAVVVESGNLMLRRIV